MTPLHYATYFDRHYLARGLALYRSLLRHSPPFVLWVLCLDDEVAQILTRLGLAHARLVSLAELEQADPALLAVKKERLPLEYYWTCGPAFLLHLFKENARIQMLTYLDADLFFFSDPTPIYDELETHSILIIEHRYPPDEARRARTRGTYNVGLVVFRATAIGLACLGRWREQCLEWCRDQLEDHRFGDQAYLDDWPERFGEVVVLQHPGAGVGPWNIVGAQVGYSHERVLINGARLIFYHFGGLRRINRWCYEMHYWQFHRVSVHPVIRRYVYGQCVKELQAAETELRKVGGHTHPPIIGRSAGTNARWRQLAEQNRGTMSSRCRRYVVVAGPFVL